MRPRQIYFASIYSAIEAPVKLLGGDSTKLTTAIVSAIDIIAIFGAKNLLELYTHQFIDTPKYLIVTLTTLAAGFNYFSFWHDEKQVAILKKFRRMKPEQRELFLTTSLAVVAVILFASLFSASVRSDLYVDHLAKAAPAAASLD